MKRGQGHFLCLSVYLSIVYLYHVCPSIIYHLLSIFPSLYLLSLPFSYLPFLLSPFLNSDKHRPPYTLSVHLWPSATVVSVSALLCSHFLSDYLSLISLSTDSQALC